MSSSGEISNPIHGSPGGLALPGREQPSLVGRGVSPSRPRTSDSQVITSSPEETHAIARDLVASLPGGSVVALHGELGSGKTCFVQGMARALGISQAVTSPTFTIVGEYEGERPLFHIDLYRIHDPDELLAIGFEDYLESEGITAIEWAERAGDLIPASTVHVWMQALAAPNEREIRIG